MRERVWGSFGELQGVGVLGGSWGLSKQVSIADSWSYYMAYTMSLQVGPTKICIMWLGFRNLVKFLEFYGFKVSGVRLWFWCALSLSPIPSSTYHQTCSRKKKHDQAKFAKTCKARERLSGDICKARKWQDPFWAFYSQTTSAHAKRSKIEAARKEDGKCRSSKSPLA